MNQQDKISLLKSLTAPSSGLNVEVYYNALEKMGDMKYNYTDYMTTAPTYCDFELKRMEKAGYELCCALFTMILREDYWVNGSFRKRYRSGQVEKLIDRMVFLLENGDTGCAQWVAEYDSYDPDRSLYGKVRYLLGTRGENPLIVIGANPSSAVPEIPDQTIKTVANVVEADSEFDSFVMINLYPQRATEPKDLHREMDPVLQRNNCKHIHELLQSLKKENITIWAAWGGLIHKRRYLKECLKQIINITNQFPCKWIQRGSYADPHHPLYLRKETPFQLFDVEMYLKKINSGVSCI